MDKTIKNKINDIVTIDIRDHSIFEGHFLLCPYRMSYFWFGLIRSKTGFNQGGILSKLLKTNSVFEKKNYCVLMVFERFLG